VARPTEARTILVYAEANGKEPFTEWLVQLRSRKSRERILRRVDRVRYGNFGDFKALGNGLFELRLFFDGGYRVYFGLVGGAASCCLPGVINQARIAI